MRVVLNKLTSVSQTLQNQIVLVMLGIGKVKIQLAMIVNFFLVHAVMMMVP